MFVALQVLRILAILALLAAAGALATPKGRLPLALRGLAKMLKSDDVRGQEAEGGRWKAEQRKHRPLAMLLVLLAVVLALI